MAEADGTTKLEYIPLLSQAFWVQVRSLPLAYMTRMMGNIIGNALGGYVVTDQSKTLERLGSYLRKVDILYEKLPTTCFCCKTIGHTESSCKLPRDEGMDDLSKPYRRWFQLDTFGPDRRCSKGPHFGFPNSLGWSMHAPEDNPLSESEAENDCPAVATMPQSDINDSYYMEGNQNLQWIKQSRANHGYTPCLLNVSVQFDPSEEDSPIELSLIHFQDGVLNSLICPNGALYPTPINGPANYGLSLIHSSRC